MRHTATANMCLISMIGLQSGLNADPPPSQQEAAQPTSVLVDPAWLEQRLNDPRVRILDLGQKKEQYDKAHIPQAAFVHWVDDITDPSDRRRYTVAPKKSVETLLGKLGVTAKTTIVLYDDLDSRISTRMFWMLRYYDHHDMHILDGGKQAWKRAGKPFNSDVPDFAKTSYRIGKVNSDYRAGMEFIKLRLDSRQLALIDGRPADQYSGEKPGKVFHTGKEHARRGHIPGAVNIVWKDNLNEDGTFKHVKDLQKLYARHGVTSKKAIVTYCNEGLHAAHPWFVLTELLGHRNIRLYDESMVEWANAPKVPIVVGTKPR